MDKDIRDKLILIFGSAGISAAVILGIKYLFPLVAPFVLAFLIAVILEGWVCRLAQVFNGKLFRGNKTAAAAVTVIFITVVIGGLVLAVGYFALNELKELIGNFDYYCALCDFQLSEACKRMDTWLGLDAGQMYAALDDGIAMVKSGIDNTEVAKALGNSFSAVSKGLVKLFLYIGAFFMALIATVYMSRDMPKFREWKHRTRFSREIDVLWQAVARLGNVYFKTQLIIICCTASVCMIGLLIIKNPYAVVIGIAIGLLDALPFFGTGTVLIPWSIISLLGGKMKNAAVLLTVYVITYFLREILESKLMGEKLDISPVAMMAAIYTGLLVFGFLGFVLGPIAYCLIKAGIQLLKSSIEHDKIDNSVQ